MKMFNLENNMIFDPENRMKSKQHRQLYAYYELLYTLVDFSAALLFVVGSILFFFESTTYFATWLFVIGSVLFGVRPTIKLARELHYVRIDEDAEATEQ